MAQIQLNDPPPLQADAPSVSQNITEVEKQFPGEIDKDLFFQFYGHPKKLSLEQGQFLLERRLQELEFKLSDNNPKRWILSLSWIVGSDVSKPRPTR